MASAFNPASNTYIIDTIWNASTSPLSGRNESFKCKSIRWVGATNGDQLVIQNFNSAVNIFSSKASNDNYADEILIEDWLMDGFKVTTIGSGIVYVDLA